MKKLTELKLYEQTTIKDVRGLKVMVMRIEGGFIYFHHMTDRRTGRQHDTSCFVPSA